MVVPFHAEPTPIEGLWLLTMKQIADDRGVVREFYRESTFVEAGLPSLGRWVQVNVTETRKGALRGLHGETMHKLVAIAHGEAFGAYVDTREASSTFGTVVTRVLAAGQQVLVPPGVCNGFQSLSDEPTQYLYCFDQEWAPDMAGTAVNPLDPTLGIDWPLPPILSDKDRNLPHLRR
jgi:dTDP-4-dehydrorhamnose 3,5-epimerase